MIQMHVSDDDVADLLECESFGLKGLQKQWHRMGRVVVDECGLRLRTASINQQVSGRKLWPRVLAIDRDNATRSAHEGGVITSYCSQPSDFGSWVRRRRTRWGVGFSLPDRALHILRNACHRCATKPGGFR